MADGPTERSPLTRQTIVDAALARVDAHGLESLSMRQLAADLGVGAMSPYRHVQDKEELLALVSDRVIEEFATEPSDDAWPEQVTRISRQVRAGLLAHPELATLVLQRPIQSSATGLRVNGEFASLLIDGGLQPELVGRVYWVMSTYVMGYTLFEIERHILTGRRPSADVESRRRRVVSLMSVLDVEIAEPEALANVLSVDSDDEQFEFGLRAMVLGLKASVDD